jgi:hypothetical protein
MEKDEEMTLDFSHMMLDNDEKRPSSNEPASQSQQPIKKIVPSTVQETLYPKAFVEAARDEDGPARQTVVNNNAIKAQLPPPQITFAYPQPQAQPVVGPAAPLPAPLYAPVQYNAVPYQYPPQQQQGFVQQAPAQAGGYPKRGRGGRGRGAHQNRGRQHGGGWVPRGQGGGQPPPGPPQPPPNPGPQGNIPQVAIPPIPAPQPAPIGPVSLGDHLAKVNIVVGPASSEESQRILKNEVGLNTYVKTKPQTNPHERHAIVRDYLTKVALHKVARKRVWNGDSTVCFLYSSERERYIGDLMFGAQTVPKITCQHYQPLMVPQDVGRFNHLQPVDLQTLNLNNNIELYVTTNVYYLGDQPLTPGNLTDLLKGREMLWIGHTFVGEANAELEESAWFRVNGEIVWFSDKGEKSYAPHPPCSWITDGGSSHGYSWEVIHSVGSMAAVYFYPRESQNVQRFRATPYIQYQKVRIITDNWLFKLVSLIDSSTITQLYLKTVPEQDVLVCTELKATLQKYLLSQLRTSYVFKNLLHKVKEFGMSDPKMRTLSSVWPEKVNQILFNTAIQAFTEKQDVLSSTLVSMNKQVGFFQNQYNKAVTAIGNSEDKPFSPIVPYLGLGAVVVIGLAFKWKWKASLLSETLHKHSATLGDLYAVLGAPIIEEVYKRADPWGFFKISLLEAIEQSVPVFVATNDPVQTLETCFYQLIGRIPVHYFFSTLPLPVGILAHSAWNVRAIIMREEQQKMIDKILPPQLQCAPLLPLLALIAKWFWSKIQTYDVAKIRQGLIDQIEMEDKFEQPGEFLVQGNKQLWLPQHKGKFTAQPRTELATVQGEIILDKPERTLIYHTPVIMYVPMMKPQITQDNIKSMVENRILRERPFEKLVVLAEELYTYFDDGQNHSVMEYLIERWDSIPPLFYQQHAPLVFDDYETLYGNWIKTQASYKKLRAMRAKEINDHFAFEELLKANNSVQLSLKSDEVLLNYNEETKEFVFKPRAISNVSPQIAAQVAPYFKVYREWLKEEWTWKIIDREYPTVYVHVRGLSIPIYFVYCSGLSDLQIGYAWNYAVSHENTGVLLILGDDNALCINVNGEHHCLEGDFSQYDMTQCEFVWLAEKKIMREVGFPEVVIEKCDSLRHATKYCYGMKITSPTSLGRDTGESGTSDGNSTITGEVFMEILYSATSLTNLRQYAEDTATRMGMKLKIKQTTPKTTTFLKGFFVFGETISFDGVQTEAVHVPLPSRILKLGKTLRHPATLFKNHPDPNWAMLCAMAKSYSSYALEPILATWVDHFDDDVQALSDGDRVIGTSKQRFSIEQCAHFYAERYGFDEVVVMEIRSLIKQLRTGSIWSHPALLRMVAVDYS